MNSNNREEFIFDWYQKHYNKINSTAVPGSISNKVLHRLIERPFKSNQGFSILEVGANKGEHISYVKNDYDKYVATDVVMDFELNRSKYPNVHFEIANAMQLQYPSESFDRVISTCVFHHLDNPEIGLRELRRVTKKKGMISILLPNDPGIMYRALRALTTLRRAKAAGLLFEAQLIHAIEHRNHYLAISTLVNWVFRNDKVATDYFPLQIPSYNLNAITCFTIEKN